MNARASILAATMLVALTAVAGQAEENNTGNGINLPRYLGDWTNWRDYDLRYGMENGTEDAAPAYDQNGPTFGLNFGANGDSAPRSGFSFDGYMSGGLDSAGPYLELQKKIGWREEPAMSGGIGLEAGLWLDGFVVPGFGGLEFLPYGTVSYGPGKVTVGYGRSATESVLPPDRLWSPGSRNFSRLSDPLLRVDYWTSRGTALSASIDRAGIATMAGYVPLGRNSVFGGLEIDTNPGGGQQSATVGGRLRPNPDREVTGSITISPPAGLIKLYADVQQNVSDRTRLYGAMEIGRDTFGNFNRLAVGAEYGLTRGASGYAHILRSDFGGSVSTGISAGVLVRF